MKVQILGPGCPRCEEAAENAKAAAQALGIEIDLEKVQQTADIAKFGVMFTPALVLDGDVKVSGRIPTVDEIKDWLSK